LQLLGEAVAPDAALRTLAVQVDEGEVALEPRLVEDDARPARDGVPAVLRACPRGQVPALDDADGVGLLRADRASIAARVVLGLARDRRQLLGRLGVERHRDQAIDVAALVARPRLAVVRLLVVNKS